MPPERDPELLSKIDLLIDMVRQQDRRLDRLEGDFADQRKEFSQLREYVAEFLEYVAEFRGEVRGRIDGLAERISDVNARLPVPIAYSPPTKPAA